MNKENTNSLIENLKSSMDTQSRIALMLDTEGNLGKTVYTKEDLFNASLIFSHVLGNISAGHCLELGFNIEQSKKIAEELGKNFRQTILLSTGIDMHTIFDKE